MPRRSRSASPPRSPLRSALPEGEEGVVLHSGHGTIVARRLRGSSPFVEVGLKGGALVEEGPASKFAADGSADLRGNRSAALVAAFDSAPERRRVRRSVEAEAGSFRTTAPLFSVGEDFAPEAATASFPGQRRNLSPDAVMGQMLGQRVQGEHHAADTFGSPRRGRGTGQSYAPILTGCTTVPRSPRGAIHRDASPITGLGEKAAGSAAISNGPNGGCSENGSGEQPQLPEVSLKRMCKVALAAAMVASSPITFPGDRCEVFSPASDAVSPISLRPRVLRREGEYSPRRHRDLSPERTGTAAERRAGSPRSPRNPVHGLTGSLFRHGQCSPRSQKSSLVIGEQVKPSMSSAAGVDHFLQGQRRWKKTVAEAPMTGGASAALQWRG